MAKNCLHVFYICLLILGCFPLDLSATHMVGGEINYRCLGNDQYELTITVFRDCDTGVPWFDNPASIGVFDVNDSLIYDLRLTLRNNDTLDLNLSDPCLVAPPNVCIHTTTYIDTVTLPFLAGGYQIVYQRCCRNQDIVNIVAPTATGATYSSYISEEALLGCNSSARFIEWPPVYVCAGVPISYDHSAFDADGDSVVYELCTPFTGATPQQSMPQPPNNPPYNHVTWLPPYGVDNMLGGPDSLKIDSATGLLTGTPDVIGVFVVGVCAKEYRNGVLISTTRRDFQYVVGVCGRIVSSAFFAPDIQCDNSLVVNFNNNSTTLGTGFLWSFGDPTTNMTSSVSNPSYIYPDTGRYLVTLIADPGTLCADTSVQEVYLQYESISADFDVTTLNCTDSFFLDVTDLTLDSISHIVNWNWDFGNGLTDSIPYPSTVYDSSGTYIITLNVEAANGCTATYMDTLVLDLPTIFSSDTVGICPGDSGVVLNPGGNPNHSYTWAPAATLSSDTAASPIASPTSTTTYTVTVVAPNGVDTCVLVQDITVIIPPPINLDVIRDTFTCQDSVWLIATVANAQTIEWATDPSFGTVLFTNDSIHIPVTGITRLFVRATNSVGCTIIDTVDVFKQTLPINVNWTSTVLVCDTAFTVQFADVTTDSSGGAIVSWQWLFGDGDTSNLQNPSHSYQQSGAYTVNLSVVTEDGCTGDLSQPINVLTPQLVGGDTVGICQGATTAVLNQNGNPNLTYLWSPGATLSDSTAVSPIANPTVPTTYTVTITAINGSDTCVNIQQVHVNFPPAVSVTVDPLTTYCGNTVLLTATSPTAISYDWSGDPSFNTILGTGSPYMATPTTFPYGGYHVRATDPYGCTATAFALVQQLNPINVNFAFQSLGCSDSMNIQFTDLTSDTATGSIVSWLWTTSDGQTSTSQHPIFTFTQSQPTTVTLEVTLSTGCQGTLSQVLDLNIASLTNDTSVVLCNGDSTVVLNSGGNPNLTYQWSPGIYLSDSTTASPLATPPSMPFTYTVTITGQSSIDTCVSIQNITIDQAPPIAIEVPKDTIVCAGVFYMQAVVTNAVQVDWSFSPLFNPVAITNVTDFYLGVPGPPFDLNMYIRVTDAYGCTLVDTARILRRNITIPVSFTPDINTCDDTLDVAFTNNTTMPAGLQLADYSWNFGNGTTANTVNGFAQYTSGSNHIVNLTATSTNGCTGSYTDTLNYDLPVLTNSDSIGLCGADSVQLNVGGNPNLTYQWFPTIGLDDPTSPSPMAGPTSNTTYSVTITAYNGTDTCVSVDTVAVGVDSFIFEAMNDTVLCTNQVTLSVNAPTVTSIDWALDRDFNLIIGQTNPLFTNIHDGRWFYVRGYSDYGCLGMDSVFVWYRGNDIPIDFSMTPVSCDDSLIVQFQDISGDTTIINWNWDFGNGQTSTLQNPTATYLTNSTYTINLQIQVQGNCNGQTQKYLTAQIPVLSVPNASLTTCGNDSIPLMIQTDSNLTYEWFPNVGLSDSSAASPMALPPATMTYRVRVYGYSNFNGVIDTCWTEDSIEVVVQAPPTAAIQGDSVYCDSLIALSGSIAAGTTLDWSTTANFQNVIGVGANLSTIMPATQQWYYLRVRDSLGCEAIDSLELNRYDVDLNLNPIYVSCEGNPIDVVAVNGNAQDTLTYIWSPNSLVASGQGTDSIIVMSNNAPATMTVVAENQYGCRDSAQTNLDLAPPLDLSVMPDTLICTTNITLSANSNTSNVQYQWATDANFNTVLGQNASLSTNVVANQTVYYIQVEDSFGCTKLDSVLVNYQPADIIVDSVGINCAGLPVQLTATNLNAQDTLTYQWTPQGSILSGQNTDSVTVAPVSTTTYTAIAQNQYGCSTTAQTTVVVASNNPTLSITATQDTVWAGDATQLIATQQSGYSYSWALDSTLSSDTIFNPTAQPVTTTTYYLTVTDPTGCATKDSITIYVTSPICDEPHIFVPNAFTPDGDGYNDVIVVEGALITDVYFVIYNRWGEQVFETNVKNEGWDGTFKGKACPPDVYGYYMKCKCLDGNEFFKKGNITLLR